MTHFKFLVNIAIAAALTACVNRSDKNDGSEEAKYIIAYNVAMNEEQSDYDIWTVDPETNERVNLTNNEDVAWTYLAIDDKILFVSDRDTCQRCYFLYEMDSDGSHIKKITRFPLRDSWMGARNDGREIVVNPHPKTR